MKLYYTLLLFVNLFFYNDTMSQTNTQTNAQNSLRYLYPTGEGKFLVIHPEMKHFKDAHATPALIKTNNGQHVNRDYLQPFMNAEQNSRSNQKTGEAGLKLAWKSAVRPSFDPFFVMADDKRVIIEAAVLQVFNSSGHLFSIETKGLGHITLDRDNHIFYFMDPTGSLNGCSMDDGSKIFDSKLLYGNKYRQILMIPKKRNITIVGNERQMDPQGRYNASQSLITNLSLEDVFKHTNENEGAKETGSLLINSEKVIAAAYGEDIVFAYPGHLMIAGPDLKIKAAYVDNFDPVAISTDDAGRIYLLNDNEKGRHLWVINSEGEKLFSVKLPGAIVYPPIVGTDYRVFIPCEKHISVIEPDGKQTMSYLIKHSYKGAIVTADNKLVVCDGPELLTFDKTGRSVVLYNFGADDLCTPPVITAAGKIFVASKQYLYCLEGK